MKTHYYISKSIHLTDLFNGRLLKCNVHEEVTNDTSPTSRFLYDQDHNKLKVVSDERDRSSSLFACDLSQDTPWLILSAIADEFDCDILSSKETALRHMHHT